ncbi:hypothetical protein [Nocardioides taihuensis]|uniref:Flagellar FliJ protein n=1 Tax=Nocardioides taihuensis TaxID=1835606 RepID=A0ABW0BET0_9ACTN
MRTRRRGRDDDLSSRTLELEQWADDVRAREEAFAQRLLEVRSILAAADARDAASAARDAEAEQRERDVDLAEMLDPGASYGQHLPERRQAVLDREHAEEDRAASREDRRALAGIALGRHRRDLTW